MSWSTKAQKRNDGTCYVNCYCEHCGQTLEIPVSNLEDRDTYAMEEWLWERGWFTDSENDWDVCLKCREQKERKNVKK